MAEIDERLENLFKELMWEETLPPRQRTRTNCVAWDSLMQLNLVTAIEQEFSISLSNEDVIDMNSFSAALEILLEKLPVKES